MMKRSRILSLVLTVLFGAAMCGTGCAKKPPQPDPDLSLEKDYVYMWHKNGLGGDERPICFQTPGYAIQVASEEGKIVGMGRYQSTLGDGYGENDFDKLPSVEMNYRFAADGKDCKFSGSVGSSRLIESGRNLQRMDFLKLRFEEMSGYWGRMEIAASLEHFSINYEMYAPGDCDADLGFTLKFGTGYTSESLSNDRGITVKAPDGSGFVFLRPKDDPDVQIGFENGTAVFSKNNVELKAQKHGGFGVIVLPSDSVSAESADRYYALEEASVSAEFLEPGLGTAVPVRFESRNGYFELDTSGGYTGMNFSSESVRNKYERVRFSVSNPSRTDLRIPLSFSKGNVPFSITGMSPMIRDAETLEPTGIQVQISKDWHAYHHTSPEDPNYAPENDVKRLWEGSWYNGYALVDVPEKSEASYEYTLAYANWGGVPAAAHAQLSLVGYLGNNQLWDQSSLGSWGESVTYDPDITLGRSMIDDVRGFMVTSPIGGNQQYNWSGNVGGADFLNYYPQLESRLVNQKVTYLTQAPNLTQVNYRGNTSDRKIYSDITINLGRTDDVVRNYYTVRYDFMEDTPFNRLSFFKIAADGYADNQYAKYAYGTAAGIEKRDVAAFGGEGGYPGGKPERTTASGDDFWFMLYRSSDEEENADVMFTVRDYRANFNGKTYEKPSYSFYNTTNGYTQASCELSPPAEAKNLIKRGSSVEFVVEYTVLPSNPDTYYGQSEYLLSTSDVMGRAEGGLQQANAGKVNAEAKIGVLEKTYPVTVRAEKQSGTVAEVEVTGGLGYLPLVFENLDDCRGYALETFRDGSWVRVDQSKNGGNDFWQAYRNPQNGTYQLVFNVANTDGLSFRTANSYRLVSK